MNAALPRPVVTVVIGSLAAAVPIARRCRSARTHTHTHTLARAHARTHTQTVRSCRRAERPLLTFVCYSPVSSAIITTYRGRRILLLRRRRRRRRHIIHLYVRSLDLTHYNIILYNYGL